MYDVNHDPKMAAEKARQEAEQYERMMRAQARADAGLRMGGPLTPAVPANEQIREIVNDVADAADVVAERRQASRDAGMQLAEAEKRYADLSTRLAQLMEQHRAVGEEA